MDGVSKRPRVAGYAIVSREGMIANADGSFPDAIKIDADQKFFHDSLRKASAVANGKHSNEGGPESAARPRLILTSKIDSLAPAPRNPKALLWNPKGASLEEAWARLGAKGAVLAIVGGTEVFGLFLEWGYDDFFLSRAEANVPDGRPVFPGGLAPEEALKRSGMTLKETRVLDQASGSVVEHWTRA
ncbi:MAG: dihydrofolate reductase [Alphaproteobacteria bacterium]|nr:dihydrofolate reductase [Alphaproteobacteria bacterium]